MKTMTRIIQLSVLTVAALSISTAMACTTGAWSEVGTTALDDTPAVALPRVSGKCAMTLTAAGSVKDNSPLGEDEVYIRFYVLGNLSADTVIFEAYSDDTPANGTKLISITFDGTNFGFDGGAGADINVPGRTGWNMIQLSWLKGGSMAYTVNADTAEVQTGSVSTTDEFMESVILGSVAALVVGDKLIFDDYESHRDTPVLGLLMGDSNGNGSINVFDLISIQNEILGNAIADGQPDCNRSGGVNVFDLICSQNVILGN
jgi:hypothetical protein